MHTVKVKRKFVRKRNSPPCEGYYMYKVRSVLAEYAGNICISVHDYGETDWLTEAQYSAIKSMLVLETWR